MNMFKIELISVIFAELGMAPNSSPELTKYSHLQSSPRNSGSVNSEILLIQTSDYGPRLAHCLYLHFIFKANSQLEHLVIRTNLVPRSLN